jgi:hypothetical protein
VELTKTRNRWSGVRIRSVSAITPQPRQAQRSATDPASRRQGPYPARRLAGPGPPLSVAHPVREPACRTPETRPMIFSRRTRSRMTRPDQLHLCGRHCLPATAPKHASGGYWSGTIGVAMEMCPPAGIPSLSLPDACCGSCPAAAFWPRSTWPVVAAAAGGRS